MTGLALGTKDLPLAGFGLLRKRPAGRMGWKERYVPDGAYPRGANDEDDR